MIRIHEGICMISVATVSSPDLLSVCVGLKPAKVWNMSHLMLRLLPLKSSTNSTWTYPPIFCCQKKWQNPTTPRLSRAQWQRNVPSSGPKLLLVLLPSAEWKEIPPHLGRKKKPLRNATGCVFGRVFFFFFPHHSVNTQNHFFLPHIIFFVKHLKSIQAQPS